jgi:hypothetical protein
MILTGRYALQSLSYSKHHRRIETTAKHSDVAKLVYHASMTELVLPRLQTCQRISMEMEEKKNMSTTRDMFKMALAVEYMKAIHAVGSMQFVRRIMLWIDGTSTRKQWFVREEPNH